MVSNLDTRNFAGKWIDYKVTIKQIDLVCKQFKIKNIEDEYIGG